MTFVKQWTKYKRMSENSSGTTIQHFPWLAVKNADIKNKLQALCSIFNPSNSTAYSLVDEK